MLKVLGGNDQGICWIIISPVVFVLRWFVKSGSDFLYINPRQTDDSHKGVNGSVDVSKKSSVPSRYHQYMTSEDEAHSSSVHSSDEEGEEEEEEENISAKGLSSSQSIKSAPPPVKDVHPVSSASGKETSKVLGFFSSC